LSTYKIADSLRQPNGGKVNQIGFDARITVSISQIGGFYSRKAFETQEQSVFPLIYSCLSEMSG
jgi:hypothetical protein